MTPFLIKTSLFLKIVPTWSEDQVALTLLLQVGTSLWTHCQEWFYLRVILGEMLTFLDADCQSQLSLDSPSASSFRTNWNVDYMLTTDGVGSKANRNPQLGVWWRRKTVQCKTAQLWYSMAVGSPGARPLSIRSLGSALLSQLSQGNVASGGKGTVLPELVSMDRSPHHWSLVGLGICYLLMLPVEF